MAAIRAFRPLVRQAPQLMVRNASATRRFLNKDTAPVIFSSHASVTGGRAEGKVTGDHLKLELGQPKEAGGDGSKANPEELFAAGYGACFQGAMAACSSQVGVKLPSGIVIDTTVHLVGELKSLDFIPRVDMKVKASGISKSDLEKVIEKTKEICPYSRALQGNVTTNVEAIVS